jgi:hypothetical protein
MAGTIHRRDYYRNYRRDPCYSIYIINHRTSLRSFASGVAASIKNMNEDLHQEIAAWLNEVVYFDNGVRRSLFLDQDRNRVFFFADPLDFDKDDSPVARYWIDQLEGYKTPWHDIIIKNFVD